MVTYGAGRRNVHRENPQNIQEQRTGLTRFATCTRQPRKISSLFPVALTALLLVTNPLSPFAEEKFPFTPQEQLEYQVKWDPPRWMFFMPVINAGKLTFRVLAQWPDAGKPVHHFQGTAVSTSSLIKVNDLLESTSEGIDLCSQKMFKRTHEGKRHREVEITINPGSKSALVVEKDIGTSPPRTLRNETIKDFPMCATDVLSAAYRARMLPLKRGESYHFLLTDNGRTQEVFLKPLQRETVKNEAGSFTTQKVEVQSFFGGLFKQRGSFYIWFADDERHLPMKFEMKVKLGKVYGNLVKIQE